MPRPHSIKPISTSEHSAGNRAGRALWSLTYLILFRPTPRPFHRWRAWLLRLFGAKIHRTAHVYPSARCWAPWNLTVEEGGCIADDVDVYCVAPIRIGAFAIVSQYSYLCAASHDFEDVSHPLTPAPISIGRRCWLAADVFVGPGVTIHDGAVIGARSTVLSDIPAYTVAAGTPAKSIRPRQLTPNDFGDDEPNGP